MISNGYFPLDSRSRGDFSLVFPVRSCWAPGGESQKLVWVTHGLQPWCFVHKEPQLFTYTSDLPDLCRGLCPGVLLCQIMMACLSNLGGLTCGLSLLTDVRRAVNFYFSSAFFLLGRVTRPNPLCTEENLTSASHDPQSQLQIPVWSQVTGAGDQVVDIFVYNCFSACCRISG
jgi:hypothetical protein